MLNLLLRPLIAFAALASLVGPAQAARVTYQVGQGPSGLALQASAGAFQFSQGPNFDGGYESLGGGMAALNVMGLVPSSLEGVAFPAETVPIPPEFDPPFIPVSYNIDLDMASASYDDQSGVLEQIGFAGGYRLTGSRISGVLAGGTLTLTDLKIDFLQGVVTADVDATRLPASSSIPGETFSLGDVALWSFSQVVGPIVFAPGTSPLGAAYSAGYDIGVLRLTADGKETLRRSFGLLVTGRAVLNALDNDPTGFGGLSANVVLTPVPEPGTYVLAVGGVAVVCAAGAARRRRRD
ncbi:MAG: hypothetical protein EOP38_28050 [Rubrivivax sp.]|nr:MAG: hypothetical protein EOP38_28050 [Rubrivivax sp.]